jgi:hypothetical protein
MRTHYYGFTPPSWFVRFVQATCLGPGFVIVTISPLEQFHSFVLVENSGFEHFGKIVSGKKTSLDFNRHESVSSVSIKQHCAGG